MAIVLDVCAAISPNEFVISYNSNNGQIEASIESDSETNI